MTMRRDVPIIVGGCHRSGTSLLRRMLDTHSRIHCGPEVKFFRDFAGDYLADPLAHLRFLSTARTIVPETELLDIMGGAFVRIHERAAARAGKRRWADKTPENVLYLEEWQRLLGSHWLFVHVVRNPLDTLASIKDARFPLTIPADLAGRVDFYLRYTQAGASFAGRYPDRCYRLAYEELVSSPAATLGALMHWLGERFEPVQLDFNELPHQQGLEDPNVVRTTIIHATSVGRWTSALTPEEASAIRAATSETWNALKPETLPEAAS